MATGKLTINNNYLSTPNELENSDLPHSLIEETRRIRIDGFDQRSTPGKMLQMTARLSKDGRIVQPIAQRPVVGCCDSTVPDPSGNRSDVMPSASIGEVELIDSRVTHLLSHIRADQLEKANLAVALADARSEVSALRDEVRLLRAGVQRLSDSREQIVHVSAAGRLERVLEGGGRGLGRDQDRLVAEIEGSAMDKRLGFGIFGDGQVRDRVNFSKGDAGEIHNYGSEKRRQLSEPLLMSKQRQRQLEETQPKGKTLSSLRSGTERLVEEISMALSFTRTIDSLINDHMPPSSISLSTPELEVGEGVKDYPKIIDGMGNRDCNYGSEPVRRRSDEQIFCLDNLERLVCRIKVWKQISWSESNNNHHRGDSTNNIGNNNNNNNNNNNGS
ncbi:hypothetical protein BY996DRAFT_7264575 [Phakopsora pachyrhizi]|nr:hypothetical protein BY996DRAFT_7264575 [Phakopsora pachyrhizi]